MIATTEDERKFRPRRRIALRRSRSLFMVLSRNSRTARCRPERASGRTERNLEIFIAIHGLGLRHALCLSGGGIRSASFALGVLQSAGASRVLKQFPLPLDVSGGGYIGGCALGLAAP